MIRSLMKLFVLLALSAPVIAQTTIVKIKPLTDLADFASIEVRVKGRLSTDPLTTHKIIGRVVLKGVDMSLITKRVTIPVPATQTWEVKSLSANFTPVATTGVAAYEIGLLQFPKSHFPPSGQVMAIDTDPNTGTIVLGPVAPIVIPPPPTPQPTPVIPPTGGLTASDGAIWTLVTPADPACEGGLKPTVKRNGVSMGAADEIKACSGTIFARDGTTWYQASPASSCGGSGWTRMAAAPC